MGGSWQHRSEILHKDWNLRPPTPLFRIAEPLGSFAYPYDVTPDGQQILPFAPMGGAAYAAPLTLLVNWEASLRK
jgi:hypothetical protein